MTILPRFELTADTRDTGTHVIHVTGEIHVSTAPEFARRLEEEIIDDAPRVTLDLTGVEFIDSTGLTVLLNGLRSITKRGGEMALAISNPTVLRLFEITRLDSTFDIEPTLEAAVRRVEGGA